MHLMNVYMKNGQVTIDLPDHPHGGVSGPTKLTKALTVEEFAHMMEDLPDAICARVEALVKEHGVELQKHLDEVAPEVKELQQRIRDAKRFESVIA